ncbi:serine/threonine-protein kinase [Streptomyces sp. NBC_01565]|uniref:serine/threonine-protein kinase n=1 Tax=Streptomyces sp. NBC_01565 TaxID=2975881 RepID=UPI00224D4796|nr:serine/threonine-protein kinase [Streptomyces sp. NBC_01565]MCX4539757.1 serine/threonine protein kinase [Streptomyces sp. NBC_01565]
MDTSEAGRQLVDGRFELISPLGAGGMGTVWRARDIALHRDVALKEVRPPDPATAAAQPGLATQLRERAIREARALARLAHPHVVTIHHIVEPADGVEGHPWIVMELVKGGSLHDRLESGPMPVADVLRLGLDVLSALRAAHAEGVLHRDVKPANVLLRPDGSAVLTDFGIAALHGSTALTSTGVLIGSPEYIAPERVRGEEGLAASDLWSLGMLMYVAAEGANPMRRASSLATVVAVLDDPIPAPVRSGPLGPVLERLLVRDPAARPDAEELELLLRNASSALGGATPVTPPVLLGQYGPPTPPPFSAPTFTPGGGSPYSPTTPVAAPRTPRRRPALMAALLTVAITGGVIGIVQALPDGGSGSGSDAKGSTASHSASASGSASGSGSGSGSTPGPKASASEAGSATVAKGSMLTPANIRIALAAFKEKTGTTTFVDLRIYDGYVLASIPTAPDAKTVDAWQYRDGAAKRTGPDGTVDEDEPLIDMSKVSWDALPELMEQSKKELKMPNPTTRYVIVEPWMMDEVPCMRPYLSDEYGQGGYVLAGIDGKIKKVVAS